MASRHPSGALNRARTKTIYQFLIPIKNAIPNPVLCSSYNEKPRKEAPSVDKEKKSSDTRTSRAKRSAERLEEICAKICDNGGQITAQNNEERLAELRTLCALIPGTPVFREYILGLLDTGELQLGGALEFFFVDAAKGKYGVYVPPVAREFERIMILIELPHKMSEAGKRGKKRRVRRLKELTDRWAKSFEEKYQQPVDEGVSPEALKQYLQHLNKSEGDENVGSLST